MKNISTKKRFIFLLAGIVIVLLAILALASFHASPKKQEPCIPLFTIDTDNDSLISSKEVLNAISLYERGRISKEMVAEVIETWVSDAHLTNASFCQ